MSISKNAYQLKIAFCGLVLLNNAIYADNENIQTLNQKGRVDRVLAAIAQSDMMHRFNGFIAEGLSLSGVPASAELDTLGKEAQRAVGIPEERHVPIRQISEMEAAAAADMHEIVLNEQCFDTDKVPYGVKRSDLFHEAVHIKYHDYVSNLFAMLQVF